MIQKNESPIDITLNKSSSGTWKRNRTLKLPFKPWQRLWLVSGIVYLLIIAGSCYLLMPSRQSVERSMVISVIEEVHRYDGMAFASESPQKIIETARSVGFSAWKAQLRSKYRIGPEGNSGFNRIDNSYQEAITDLPVKQTIGILIAVVAWLVPMTVLYALGFVVDWIKRGATGVKG